MSREQAMVSPLKTAGGLPRLGVVGVGAVGTTLAWGLAACGYPVVALSSRASTTASWLSAQLPGCRAFSSPGDVAALADLVLLAVPDDAIASVAAAIPWRPDQAVVHCSGASPARVLAVAGAQGALYGSFHPLLSVSRARPAHAGEALARLTGCAFAIEAPEPLAARLAEMASRLGGRTVYLREKDRVPYHLAAVLVSNYPVALVAAATDLWASFGVSREEALVALLPLLRSTVANLAHLGLPESLTGPIARGDVGTVHAHLEYLERKQEDAPTNAALLREIYRLLGVLSLPLAQAKGRLTEEQLRTLERLLDGDTESNQRGTA
ncbi:MAG TPA: Rossmann-like and DUF2520 domain-containing protein [Ktedonobacterales bacterium]|jgi:predicted short-subunit dehydrogenase-like oxidoreductase (DUF2520 family)